MLDSVTRLLRKGRRQQNPNSPANLEELDHKLVRSLAKNAGRRWTSGAI